MAESNLVTANLVIRADQKDTLLSLAAKRQFETKERVSVAEVAREVIDAGLDALGARQPSFATDTTEA